MKKLIMKKIMIIVVVLFSIVGIVYSNLVSIEDVSNLQKKDVSENEVQTMDKLGAYYENKYIPPKQGILRFDGVDYAYYTLIRIKPNTDKNPVYYFGNDVMQIIHLIGYEQDSKKHLRLVDSQGGEHLTLEENSLSGHFNGIMRFSTTKEVLVGVGIITKK